MFDSAVQFDDEGGRNEAPESMRVIFTYKPAKGGRAAVSRFVLFYKDMRIYATDCDDHGSHNNKDNGKGRPFHRKTVSGIHEHLWSEADQDRYAEPLADELASDVLKVWQHFSKTANLSVPNGFVYPPTQKLWTQTSIPYV